MGQNSLRGSDTRSLTHKWCVLAIQGMNLIVAFTSDVWRWFSYVSNILWLIALNNSHETAWLKALFNKEFEIKDLEAAKKILGIQIHKYHVRGHLWLNQSNYCQKIIDLLGMSNAKTISISLANDFRLSIAQCPLVEQDINDMKIIPHDRVFGSLMYVMLYTRPDIAHALGLVSILKRNPRKKHCSAVQWIPCYLNGPTDVGLLIDKGSFLLVHSYVDVDFVRDLGNQISKTGFVFMLGKVTMSCKWTLQDITTLSTIETKYMTAMKADNKALWLKVLTNVLSIYQDEVPLISDSSWSESARSLKTRGHVSKHLPNSVILKINYEVRSIVVNKDWIHKDLRYFLCILWNLINRTMKWGGELGILIDLERELEGKST